MTISEDQKQLSLLISGTQSEETGILWGTVLHGAMILVFITIFLTGTLKHKIVPEPKAMQIECSTLYTKADSRSFQKQYPSEINAHPEKSPMDSPDERNDPDLVSDILDAHVLKNETGKNTDTDLELAPDINDILFASINQDTIEDLPLSTLLLDKLAAPDDAEDDFDKEHVSTHHYLFNDGARKHTIIPEHNDIDNHPEEAIPHPLETGRERIPGSEETYAAIATILNDLDIEFTQATLYNPERFTILPQWINYRWLTKRILTRLAAGGLSVITPREWSEDNTSFLTLSIKASPVVKVNFQKKTARTRAAIVVDDIGFGGKSTERLLKVPAPLTMAILPFCRGSVAAAAGGMKAGQEVILHMPMEPKKYRKAIRQNIGIFTDQSSAVIVKRLTAALNSLPAGIEGINNHMGSAFTETNDKLIPVMEVLKRRGLYFLDSFTSKSSCAVLAATRIGVKTGMRNFEFIDNASGVKYSQKQFNKLISQSKRYKNLITIMHDRKNSVVALENSIEAIRNAGIELTFASEILEHSIRR